MSSSASKDSIENSRVPLKEFVLENASSAANLLAYDCDLDLWEDKSTIEYIISSEGVIDNVLRYLYCSPDSKSVKEIETIRQFVEERKREALDISLTDSSPWHLYSIEEYFLSIAALELILDGVLNPEPLEKLGIALDLHHRKTRTRMGWKTFLKSAEPTTYMHYGLIAKILLGDGDAVIEYMKKCREKRKVQIEWDHYEGQIYKILYHTAMLQMKKGDQESAYHGQRTHGAFHSWVWLNMWKEDIPPSSFVEMFMLWAAIRKVNGESLDPEAIIQSFQPELICNLCIDYL